MSLKLLFPLIAMLLLSQGAFAGIKVLYPIDKDFRAGATIEGTFLSVQPGETVQLSIARKYNTIEWSGLEVGEGFLPAGWKAGFVSSDRTLELHLYVSPAQKDGLQSIPFTVSNEKASEEYRLNIYVS